MHRRFKLWAPPAVRRWIRLFAGTAAIALVAGCPGIPALSGGPVAGVVSLADVPGRVPPIVGRVLWPPQRSVQAEMTDVALRATVTLIDVGTNTSLGSTVSSANGAFSLESARGFVPKAGAIYYVEAYKGLFNNAVGRDAARVRSALLFQGGWQSLTSGGITISRGTTTVCALWDLKQIPAAQRAAAIGKLGTTQEPDLPPPFDTSGTGISDAEFATGYAFVTKALRQGDRDPLDSLIWTNGALALKPGLGLAPPEITDVVPSQAVEGDLVSLYGRDFDAVLSNNQIDFGGVLATPSAVSGGRIDVPVPPGARSGLLTLWTAQGSGSISFTVLPIIPGKFIGF